MCGDASWHGRWQISNLPDFQRWRDISLKGVNWITMTPCTSGTLKIHITSYSMNRICQRAMSFAPFLNRRSTDNFFFHRKHYHQNYIFGHAEELFFPSVKRKTCTSTFSRRMVLCLIFIAKSAVTSMEPFYMTGLDELLLLTCPYATGLLGC